eukprot:gnl/MRDRNA2_/MRDRNA2_70427_c0_seq1.p1 gnl/MRDRNA2_/MRDRNA2_70427_c0~~gnl/MRDRNA2_/MRDRNA2_70427_c0_seq1.p1  ORF type:complete len:267 (+),score=69.89 gnl/MRDRNA2_/MRDRNA2_70427_c0_seq1:68-868(+)
MVAAKKEEGDCCACVDVYLNIFSQKKKPKGKKKISASFQSAQTLQEQSEQRKTAELWANSRQQISFLEAAAMKTEVEMASLQNRVTLTEVDAQMQAELAADKIMELRRLEFSHSHVIAGLRSECQQMARRLDEEATSGVSETNEVMRLRAECAENSAALSELQSQHKNDAGHWQRKHHKLQATVRETELSEESIAMRLGKELLRRDSEILALKKQLADAEQQHSHVQYLNEHPSSVVETSGRPLVAGCLTAPCKKAGSIKGQNGTV